MIALDDNTKKILIDIYNDKGICLEGNIIKLLDTTDTKFNWYIETCLKKDKEVRKKRLEITKKIQQQNKELIKLNSENSLMNKELEYNLKKVNEAKEKIEEQNKQLLDWKDEQQKLANELLEEMKKSDAAKIEAENAKINAENDLNLLQKRTQFHLMNIIVRMALFIIVGVGILTTLLYIISIITGKETQIIGSTWSNLFGILLTNAFSIVGTIMGVRYATEKQNNYESN